MGEKKINSPAAIKKYDLQDNDLPVLPTVSIDGLEVFAVGTYNGDTYTLDDLRAMVAAFEKVKFDAPITQGKPAAKIGHQDGQEDPKIAERLFGSPALGYVSRLYIEGDKLLADFREVPRRFGMLIKAGAYRRVSAEIYWNYKDSDGATYPRVLKAVSFLGADIPALTNLKEIEALYKKTDGGALFAYDGDHEYRVYCLSSSSSGMSMADFLIMYPRKEKADVKFSEGDEDERCGKCKYWVGGYNACTLVEGRIVFEDWCDLYEPYFSGEYAAREKAIKANAHGGQMKTVKLSRDQVRSICPSCADNMETKGIASISFDTQEEAECFVYMTAAECMKDDKMMEKYPDSATRKEKCAAMAKENIDLIEREIKRHSDEGGSMNEAELKAEREKLEQEQKAFEQKKKDFEAKQSGATEAQLKADKEKAEQDAKDLRDRLARLEAEGTAREIDGIVRKWHDDKKVVPADEPKLRALLHALRGQPKIVKFSEGEGEKKKDFEMTPEDALRAIIDARKPHQLFTEFSREGTHPDERSYDNPGDETHAKTLQYMEEHKEKSYQIALHKVLDADPALKERYAATRQ